MGTAFSALLHEAGADVALIARGASLTAIRESGVTLHRADGTVVTAPVRAFADHEYDEVPDVVILCVKSYSLDDVIPFLSRVVSDRTTILPLLNVFEMGRRLRESIGRQVRVIEAVAYIAVELKDPGVVAQKLHRFRIVMGAYEGLPSRMEVEAIAEDFRRVGANVDISDQMFLETILKFIRVSTLSAAEVLYDTDAEGVRDNPEAWRYYCDVGDELVAIATAAGFDVPGDPLQVARESVSTIRPDYTTSLMHDVRRGRQTEAQSQFFDVYDLGRSHGLDMQAYGKVSQHLGHRASATSK